MTSHLEKHMGTRRKDCVKDNETDGAEDPTVRSNDWQNLKDTHFLEHGEVTWIDCIL